MCLSLQNSQVEAKRIADEQTAFAIRFETRPGIGKSRCRAQHLAGDAVNGSGTRRDGDARIDQCFERIARLQTPICQRHAAKLQDTRFPDIEPGGLGVECHRVGGDQRRGVRDGSHDGVPSLN